MFDENSVVYINGFSNLCEVGKERKGRKGSWPHCALGSFGKTILLHCDDPEWSNFTKFFAQNFESFGLKKLISTSYAVELRLDSTSFDMQKSSFA